MEYTKPRTKPPKAKWLTDIETASKKLPSRKFNKKDTPINFYCDVIGTPLGHKHCRSFWSYQEVLNHTGTIDKHHFTGNSLLDHTVLSSIDREVNIKLFKEGLTSDPGTNLAVIGLMGGFTPYKLEALYTWFQDPTRIKFWRDDNFQIVLDYCQEGFDVYFPFIHNWVDQYSLHNRVTIISGSHNIAEVLQNWERHTGRAHNFETIWYGFFTDWFSDRMKLHNIEIDYAPGDKRLMCLNRRPHEHRMLLATLLEKENLIEKIGISFPKHMNEDGPYKTRGHDNVYGFWNSFVEYQSGRVDHLTDVFDTLHKKLPLIADTDDFDTNHALDFNINYYKNFPINIITETLFFTQVAFPSEKLWKPIGAGQIFLVMSCRGFLKAIRDIGFKTFSPWINEDYDNIEEPYERANALITEIKRITSLSETDFNEILVGSKKAIKHNKELLLNNSEIKKLVSIHVVEYFNNL